MLTGRKLYSALKKKGGLGGGDWKSFKDYPHLEKTNGYKLSQLKAKYKAKDFIKGTKYLNL